MNRNASFMHMVATALVLSALGTLLPLLLRGAPSAAWTCPESLSRSIYLDCGNFPDDVDIMRVPAHSSGTVVARWALSPYIEPKPYPWRIINNHDADIAVFLGSKTEFDSFLARVPNDPALAVCEVKDRDWTWVGGSYRQCTDAYGNPTGPCPWDQCGVHFVYRATYCPAGFSLSCGGTFICNPPGAVVLHYTIIANPPC